MSATHGPLLLCNPPVRGLSVLQVMSAQAGGDAPLREEQQGRPMEATEQAEETAATSSGAVGSTVPEGPQMNGGGSGGGRRGLEKAVIEEPKPSSSGTAEHELIGSRVQSSMADDGGQRIQAEASIEPQRISSEAIPAAAPSGDHASYSAMGGGDSQSGAFATPRSSRSVPSFGEGFRPAHGAWPGWITRLGDMFKAPPVAWLPSPLPSPPRPRRLLEPQRGPEPGQSFERVAGMTVEEHRASGLGPNYKHPKQQQHTSGSDPSRSPETTGWSS